MIPVGHLKQKASPIVVVFVLGCSAIITGLLFVMQKAEALKDTVQPSIINIPWIN